MRHAYAVLSFVIAGCSASHAVLADDAGRESDAFVAIDAAMSDSGARNDAGQPPSDAAAASDTGSDAGADASGADAGPAVAGRVACGASDCTTGEGCLASCLDASDVRTPACVAVMPGGMFPEGACPTGHEMFPRYWVRCDGTEDCTAGEACHLIFGSTGQFAWCDTCAAPCNHQVFQMLCHGDTDCPADAPHCMPTNSFSAFWQSRAP